MTTQRKPFGLGTLSLLILAMGFAFNYGWGEENFRLGYRLFELLNLPIYSNGDQGLHIPFVATAIFWIPTIWIAKKNRSHYGSSVACNVAAFMLVFCIIGPIITVVDWFVNA
ncbi:hypothetical protein C161_20752 [Paenibacillus sp. FSL R5-192]|uniref:hypothetical protein n=1 Tax=Paenibacillus TaxID=44249 RepID=UPI0003E26506|nr:MULTISPECIES: hypothetical protein [Paenibacillus]APO44181.1 hypothetical protein BS614_09305 [Paenibacillus xylanexedens]ETT33047.1 hypothetical protein C161_20752 [Paenibacillus sp. FSL R5-192]KLU53054.1 hypothetical protein EL84_11840 [Paenibacillus sp. VT-400]WJM09367.1 hypothetical protein QNO02_05345 [Paenibacillus sp. PK1-4R]